MLITHRSYPYDIVDLDTNFANQKLEMRPSIRAFQNTKYVFVLQGRILLFRVNHDEDSNF